MKNASEFVAPVIGSEFGRAHPNSPVGVARAPAAAPQPGGASQAEAVATSLPASQRFNEALNGPESGQVLVNFKGRRLGQPVRQIAPHGPIYRGPTQLGLEGPKMAPKA